jgi:ABC-type enterochelin transport system substrate-binding protein
MKTALFSLFLSVSFLLSARADLTIVYSSTLQPASQAEKSDEASAARTMSIKIKGDKARIEASPQLTTILDGKTGEVVNLMNDLKIVVRISPD